MKEVHVYCIQVAILKNSLNITSNILVIIFSLIPKIPKIIPIILTKL
jgi:hypothetical protein